MVLNQDYAEFEVIVVDDASTDGSEEYLRQLVSENPHLIIYRIDENEKSIEGKKQALLLGIQKSKYECILLTDADCLPQSNQWIQSMISQLTAHKNIVLGYSPIREAEGILGSLQVYDSFLTAVLYLNLCRAGLPYMGVGRNIAYHNALFKERKIDMRMEIMGGDDDLLVNQLASSENTVIEIRPEAETVTSSKTSWSDYLRQKRRHYEPSFAYQFKHILLLLLYNGSKALLYMCLIYLLFNFQMLSALIVGTFILFLAFQLYSNYKNGKVLRMRNLILLMPIMDFFSVFFNSFVLMTNLFTSSKEWN